MPARSSVKVGQPRWSSTKRRGPPAAARRSTVLTMLAPCGPHTQEVRTTAAPGSRLQDLPFAAQLAPAVDRLRIGPIPFVIGPGCGPVEDVVRGHRNQMGADGCGPLGHVPAGQGVHLPGPVRVRLTRVDRGPGRGVNHQVGPQARHRRQHRVPVGHVELGPVGGDHFVVGLGDPPGGPGRSRAGRRPP